MTAGPSCVDHSVQYGRPDGRTAEVSACVCRVGGWRGLGVAARVQGCVNKQARHE